jgi:hypothetical protein
MLTSHYDSRGAGPGAGIMATTPSPRHTAPRRVPAVVPGYSERRPQPLNIAWAGDAELGGAAWLAQTPGGEPALPPELRRAAPFGEPPAWLPPMLAGPAAPAAPLGLPRPRVEVITRTDETSAVLKITPATPGSRILIEAGAGASTRIEAGRSRRFAGVPCCSWARQPRASRSRSPLATATGSPCASWRPGCRPAARPFSPPARPGQSPSPTATPPSRRPGSYWQKSYLSIRFAS